MLIWTASLCVCWRTGDDMLGKYNKEHFVCWTACLLLILGLFCPRLCGLPFGTLVMFVGGSINITTLLVYVFPLHVFCCCFCPLLPFLFSFFSFFELRFFLSFNRVFLLLISH